MTNETGRSYGVRLVRGPVVEIEQRRSAPASTEELTQRSTEGLTSADLFCGCGGISLGLEEAGITSLVGVDFDPAALETWGGLFAGLPIQADLHKVEEIDRISELLAALRVDVIAGGPPCQPFSRAGRSGIRHLVREGKRDSHDRRRDLWESFVEITRRVRPRAVIMENVPELALADDMLLLRTIVDEFEAEGYSVYTRILSATDFGVPQHRQRLILVGLRDRQEFNWPEPDPRFVSLADAVEDLPPVEGGWRPSDGAKGWMLYQPAQTEFVREMRKGVDVTDEGRLYDHITRPVREDDRQIFEQMDASTKYTDLPEELRRYRDDIFTDKYKRLNWSQPSRSITAHIAKDGYWYIHPSQHRTLTIREAARIQTFPDRVRFAGPPSAAFRQIGNAVPPRLAQHVAQSVVDALLRQPSALPSTREIMQGLANWFRSHNTDELTWPWLGSPDSTPWRVVAAELLFRRDPTDAKLGWPAVLRAFPDPKTTIDNAAILKRLTATRPDRGAKVASAAHHFAKAGEPTTWEELGAAPSVSQSLAKLAFTAGTPHASCIVPTHGALRIAARFTGLPVDLVNKTTDGRVAIARLAGGRLVTDESDEASHTAEVVMADSRAALLALFELAETVCTNSSPKCSRCPLKSFGCKSAA